MTADILAQQLHFALKVAPGSRMGGAGELLQHLGGFQAGFSPQHGGRCETDGMGRCRGIPPNLSQAVGAAQAATGAPGHVPATFTQSPRAGRSHFEVDFHPLPDLVHVHPVQFVGGGQQALGDTETEGKIFQIAR